MNKQDLEFKEKFLKLVEEFPSNLGGFLEEQMGHFESDAYTKPETYETSQELLEEMKKFTEKYPDYKVLPADNVRFLLFGWLIYTVVEGKEIAKYLAISLSNLRKSGIDLSQIIKDNFMKYEK